MKTNHKFLSSAILLACGAFSSQSQAALPVDPLLNYTAGVTTCNTSGACFVKSGSYFGMDTSGNGSVSAAERTALAQNMGLRISTATLHNADAIQAASGSHTGAPDGSETPGIDAAWNFFGNTGLHYTNAATKVLSASGNNATIDLSGWGVTWNGIPAINMGAGAWGSNPAGVANLVCAVDCAEGDTYTLDYTATVPLGDPSGFGGVKYNLHLEGTIGGFNTPPVTSSFPIQVIAGSTSIINLLTHVTNNDGFGSIDATSVVISNDGSCGTITDNNDGTVTVPSCGASSYTFDYTISDGYETSSAGTVSVTVVADPKPLLVSDTAQTDGVTPVIIDVLNNDTDTGAAGGIDPTTVAIASMAAHGNTSVNATTGAITYTADAGFAGTDTFTYTVDDGLPQTSDPGTVTVTVNALNTPASSFGFAPGTTAIAAGSTTGIVTIANIGVADNATFPEITMAKTCIGGCFDFVLSGVTPGGTGTIVLPLSTPIPAKGDPGNSIVYRKFKNGSWVSFDTTINTYKTAPGTVTGSNVSCPPADSTEYVGSTTGHSCLLLTITDGGPNDADGLADGTIVDPGGLGEITRITSTDGCSMTGNHNQASDHAEWLVLAGFMGLLGWMGLKRRKA